MRTLRARIAATAFCLLAVVMGAALSYTLGVYERGALALISDKENATLSMLELFARDALLTRNYAALQPQLAALAGNPDVNAALLASSGGVIVASSEPARIGAALPATVADAQRYWRTRAVGSDELPFGTIAVEFSAMRRMALEQSVRDQAILAGLIGTLVCAAAALLIAHLLARRLGRVMSAVRRVRDGDMAARTELQPGDEIGELGTAFDGMLDHLARTQDELRTYQGRLEELVERRTEELHALQAKLLERERLSALGELTATVSHELRNPLGTIGASLHLLRHAIGDASSMAERALRRADRSMRRCVRIIDDLKDYSAELALRESRFDLDVLVRQIVERIERPEAVQIETDVARGLAVEGDRDLLGKAIEHVVRNAIQATNERDGAAGAGRVLVRAALEHEHALVEVCDEAGGIREEDLEKVFTPLFSTRSFGAGLGLPIAQRILSEHGGLLAVTSAEGHGTTVSARIPVTAPVRDGARGASAVG